MKMNIFFSQPYLQGELFAKDPSLSISYPKIASKPYFELVPVVVPSFLSCSFSHPHGLLEPTDCKPMDPQYVILSFVI